MKKTRQIFSVLLTLAMLLSLVPAMGVTASAAGTEIEAVSFTYTGYAEGENVADAVVTCNTAGVDFTYKWQYSDSGGSYSDATKLSAQFISGIKYTLWIYFKAQDGLALAELNETDVTLGGNNPGVVYTNYTIDEVKYSYGVPFSMSPLGGVTKYIVGFYTQGGKIGEESYRVELITGTDGKLTAEQVPTPTKEHYTFDGWYTAESGGTLLSLDTVYTDPRNQFYARWVPAVDIDVTFDANGGKVNGKDTDTITIPAADKGKLASLPVPTREGYTFDGWYTAASGGMKITETTVFSEATTVYALWGAIDSVSFSYTGYTEGENVADAVVTCNTAGVDFTYKWQYSDSGGSYSDATKLSAQFISGIKYTLWIYFKAQDGLALAELNETDVTLGGNNPGVVYTNYTIDEVKYSYGVPFSMSPLGGVTKYIVGFYTQGGKIGEESYRVELITGTDGKLTAEQVPTPTKEHYTFDGWYTAESGGTLLSLDTVYTDSSSKYYARWTENPALTGTATITGTAKFGQTLTASLESGNNTGTLSYQWKRDGSDISGAMNSTYTLVKADIGKTITVAISSSVESGTIVSPATATVGKADTPSAPTGLSGLIGQPLSTVTLPSGWTWVDGTTVMNTAGTQTFKANYTDAAGNYENATNVDVSVNVTAKSTAALTGLTQSGCTYGETLSAPSYTKPAGTIDSTIKVTYMGKGGTTYAESAAKPVKSGTYTVKVTLETADTIYSGTADFTIAQKDVTIRGFKVPNSAYNGDKKTSFNAAAAEIVGKITGDDVTIDTTAAEANFAQKDVGSDIPVNFTGVKLAGADKDNYRINSVEPAKANIYQRTLTVKPDSGFSKKYGEADPALSSTVSGTIYGEMYIIDGKLEREAGENVGNYKILLGTLALKDNGAFKASNYILSLDTTAVYFEIKKAPAPSAPTGLSGMKGKTLATVPLTGGWTWADDTTVMSAAGTQTFKANYTDTTGNYENATNVDVTVEVIDKTNVSASITFADGELTYNGAGQAYETASISGITAGANPGWTYVYAPSGTGSLDASGKPQNAGTYTVTATYEDDDNYGTKSAVLKIKKAVPTGTPKYTEITSSDKTLADAAITTTGADFTALGTVIWVADDGVTPLPDTTVVAANTYYKWLFTPTDTDNYETLTGTIRLYYKSSGGGGGRSTSRYTVSFESNGGSKVSNQTVTRNSVMKEPTAPTKENFDFDGWYSDKKLKTKYDFSAKVTKSFTLYAKWTEKDNSVNQIILTIGKKDTQVFGKAKSNDVAPKIVNNRTMLPARFVAENLGADVSWNGDKELVTIKGKNLKTGEDVTILITIGAATAKVNGKEIKLDSAAFVENDRTYTPIRFISEELGASVEWVEKDEKVIITKPEIKKAETK